MSHFVDSISTIIRAFYEHATDDGDGSILSRRDMKEFILKEFADVIANPRDSQTVDKILHFLEWDGDGKIDFNEFLFLVFRVAKACYWYLQKKPCLLQRTKLITSEKSLEEPEINNRGRQRQLQEEEPQSGESDHHRSCEPQTQRDTRVHKLETLEEVESHHQQRNTRNRDDAKRISKSGDPTSQVYEEGSQEPCNQRNIRQPPELDRQEDVQSHSESRKPKPLVDERGSHQTRQPERKGEVRTHCAPHESESQPNERGSLQARRPQPQADERQNQEGPQPDQVADVKSHKQPSKHQPLGNLRDHREFEVETFEVTRSRPQEQKGLQRKELKSRYQSYIDEPIVVEQSCYETHEPRRRVYEELPHRERKAECLDRQRKSIQAELCGERDDGRREVETNADETRREYSRDHERDVERRINKGRVQEEPPQERRIIRSRELEVDISESTQRLKREREERGPIETYERTRRTVEVAAEADVRIQRVTRESEPRGDIGRREQGCEVLAVERRIRQGREQEEPPQERRIIRSRELEVDVSESTQRLTTEREETGPAETYERTRRTVEAAAEADVRVQRVTREPEPRSDTARRDRDCDVVEVDRRIWQGREREEPPQERRIIRSRELDVDVSESIQRLTREREERGPVDTYERTQRTVEAAAEADVRVQRVTREPEDRSDTAGREPDCEAVEAERRIWQGREREEPPQERRIIRSRELDVDVSESTQHLTTRREEAGPVDTYERTRRTVEAAAEADVRVQRVTREPEPRRDVARRDRECDRVEVERRIRQGRVREEPPQERRIIRSRELEVDVSESIQRLTREREEAGPADTYERTQRTLEVAAEADIRVQRVTREPETRGDRGRREQDCEVVAVERRIQRGREREEPPQERRIVRSRELDVDVSESTQRLTTRREEAGPVDTYERTRRTVEAAAEADVRVQRVTREPEPRSDTARRDRDCDVVEVDRRIRQGREREEPPQERRIIRSRELDVDVSESIQRLTREREERGPVDTYERTRRTVEAAAEADVRVQRVTREPEPHGDVARRDRECDRVEAERRIRQGRVREEPPQERRIIRSRELEVDISESTQRLKREREERGPVDTYERTQRTVEVAAEADVRVQRVTREPEDQSDTAGREQDCEAVEAERRIWQGKVREEPPQERRIIRSRELEVDVSESTQRLTREREEAGPADTYERTRRTLEAAAEADIRVQRVTRKPEPRGDMGRREQDCEVVAVERRIQKGREWEEPPQERRIVRSRELDVDVSESTQHLTTRREEAGPVDTYERTRRTVEAAAEADVRVQRVTREPEPRSDTARRDRDCDVVEVERRIRQGREREEPPQERRIIRSRELEVDVSESSIQRLTREREEAGPADTYERTRRTLEAAAEADIRVQRVTREPETRGDRGRREQDCEAVEAERRIWQGRQREGPPKERRIIRSRELEVDVSESTQRLTTRREEAGPVDTYERTRRTVEAAAEADVRVQRVSREPEPRSDTARRDRDCDVVEVDRRIRQGREREEPPQERRIIRSRELDVDVSESIQRLTRERGERGPVDTYKRTRRTVEAAAEADVRVQRVTREPEDRSDTAGREPDCEAVEAERRIRQGREREEPPQERRIIRSRELEVDVSESTQRLTREREEAGPADTYERTRCTLEAAAEADIRVQHVTREPETRGDRGRREQDCDVVEVDRRIRQGREREEPPQERRIIRSRELDVDVSESIQRLTREREERGPVDTYERTRRTLEAAAEADVRVQRVTREPEPHGDVARRDRECDRVEAERRIRQGREREEPPQERRIIRSRELDVDVSESTQRLTREREERGPVDTYERTQRTVEVAAEADVRVQRVTREPEYRSDTARREQDCEVVEAERRIWQGGQQEAPPQERRIIRSRELDVDVSESIQHLTREREERGPIDTYERTRRTVEVAAEADVKVRRVTREPESRGDVARRDRECDTVEVERRIRQGKVREEPPQERRIIRSRELDADVSESIQRLTTEREERGPVDTYERTQRTVEVAAEADVRVQRVTREPEDQSDTAGREQDCEAVEAERRIWQGREREEPPQERRIIRSRELEVDVSESTQRLTTRREEAGPVGTYERTRRTLEAAAEADVRVQRVTREPEPRSDAARRGHEGDVVEVDRRIRQGREREEPPQERRIIRSRELEVDVSESTQRLTRDREERGPIDTYERTRCTVEVAAEADVRVQRVTREPEARRDVASRNRESDIVEVERIRQGQEREEDTLGTEPSCEDESSSDRRSFYQTVELDRKDLSLAGEPDSISDLSVRYLPDEPDVKVLPQPFEPRTVAYLIHVIQNLNDPEAVTYEIVCQQPQQSGQPIYVRKCYVSPQPSAVPCEGSSHQEPERREDKSEAGEPVDLEPAQCTGSSVPEAQPGQSSSQQPAASSPEDRKGDLKEPHNLQDTEGPCEQERAETEAKEGEQQESPSESVKGEPAQPCKAESGEDGTNNQCPRTPEPNAEPQQNGSKSCVEECVPRAPEPACPAPGNEGSQAQPTEGESPQREEGQQENQRAEGEAKRSQEPGNQGKAPELQESGGRKAPARKSGQRAAEKTCPQPRAREESGHREQDADRSQENGKRSCSQASAAPAQREDQRPGTKQSQDPAAAAGEAKAP